MSSGTMTMSSGSGEEEVRLLFFGTFFHENTEQTADLIQLKQPVRVTEIRVIPLGAAMNLSTGCSQLGATNPSEFDIEFYYNDLQVPSKSTFELLRVFNFNDKARIQLVCGTSESELIITDGLLVRGTYSTVTLAVYGFPVDKVPVKEVEVAKTVEVLEEDAVSKDKENTQPSNTQGDGVEEGMDVLEISESDADALVIPDEAQKSPSCVFQQAASEQEKTDGVDDHVKETDAPPDPLKAIVDVVEREERSAEGERPQCPMPEVMDTEEISDGEVFASDEENYEHDISSSPVKASLHDKIGTTPEKEEGDKVDPLIEEAIEEAESISSVAQDPIGEGNDDSLMDELQEQAFEEIMSDEEIDFPEYDYGEWEEWANKFSKPFNPFSDSFEVLSTTNLVPGYASVSKKSPAECLILLRNKCEEWNQQSMGEDCYQAWVEDVEKLLPFLPPALFGMTNGPTEELLRTLQCWVRTAVNFDAAIQQPLLPFKTRHIKVGLKLVQILTISEGKISETILKTEIPALNHDADAPCSTTRPLQHYLLDLLESRAISKAFKLLVLKAIDASVTSEKGFNMFKEISEHNAEPSCYQRLNEYSMDPAFSTRMSFSLRSLLNKLKLMDGLQKLSRTFQSLPVERSECLTVLKTGEMCKDLEVLQDAVNTARHVDQLLAQPARVLPAKTVIEILSVNPGVQSPKYSFVRILQEVKFLGITAAALTLRDDEVLSPACSQITELLTILLGWEEGLFYLCNENQLATFIIQYLLRDPSEDELTNVGLLMGHCLELIHIIDVLSVNHPPTPEVEDLHKLQTAVGFLSTAVGRDALLKVFTQGTFILPLLRCIHSDDPSYLRLSRSEKLVLRGYSVLILDFVVRQSESLKFLEKHAVSILTAIKHRDDIDEGCDKLQRLEPFLLPTQKATIFSLEGIEALCELIKVKKNDLLLFQDVSSNWGYPPEMITCFRILCGLAVGPEDDDLSRSLLSGSDELRIRELKYDLAVAKIHYLDMLSTMVAILQKVVDEFSFPALHMYQFTGSRSDMLICLIHPIIKIVRKCVTQIIHARKTEFRDVTAVPTLLKVYGIMESFYSAGAISNPKAKEVTTNIIGILLAYTIPAVKLGPETEDELTKSTWTSTVSEILKFTLDTPANFQPGLTLLGELLPLPLPKSVEFDLSQESCDEIVRCRRLWSAHIHCVSSQIQELIGLLCVSTNTTVSILLKRVCHQLADLSSSTCLVVCRGILDVYICSLELDSVISTSVSSCQSSSVKEWVDTAKAVTERQCSDHTARILGFLASLVNNCSAIKSGILQAVKGSTKVDEKYCDILNSWGSILLVHQGIKLLPSHLQAQYHVVTIFQSLCDAEISMLVPMFGRSRKVFDPDAVVANSLPNRDFLHGITSSLFNYLNTFDANSLNSQVLEGVLRALEIICETDYGFCIVFGCLEQYFGVFRRVTDVISSTMGHGGASGESFESLYPCLMTYLDFLKAVITSREERMNNFPPRLSVVSAKQLVMMLESRSTQNEEKIAYRLSLSELQVLIEQQIRKLKEGTLSFNALEVPDLEAAVVMVQQILDKTKDPESEGNLNDSKLPASDNLTELFNVRPLYTVADKSGFNENLPAFWITSMPPAFEIEGENEEQDLESCDLEGLCRTLLGDFDIAKEVQSLAKTSAEPEPPIPKKSDDTEVEHKAGNLRNHGPGHGLGLMNRLGQFGGHMRGGGRGMFARGMSMAGRGYDPFRSRPPNTSRPPSLHVDDFVALEGSPRASSAGDSYNVRGRGMPRGSAPVPYSHPMRGLLVRPSSFIPSFYGTRRHDSATPMGPRFARGGRIFSTPNSDRWTADSRHIPSYDRTIRPAMYDDKYRSPPAGSSRSSTSSPRSSLTYSQQQRPTVVYRDPRNPSSSNPNYPQSRWRDRQSSSKPYNR